MLFLCFIASVCGSSGWLVFWSLAGIVFSDRRAFWFMAPLITGLFDSPEVGVFMILFSWACLAWGAFSASVRRQDERDQAEAWLLRARANFPPTLSR